MFPFGPFDTATIALVVVIVLSYVIFLRKFGPSRADRVTTARQITPQELEEAILASSSRNAPPPKETAKTRAKETAKIETKAPARRSSVKAAKPVPSQATSAGSSRANNDSKRKKKGFFLFGKQDFQGCAHEFGHLKTLKKNTPIPDECFGCTEILECLAVPSDQT